MTEEEQAFDNSPSLEHQPESGFLEDAPHRERTGFGPRLGAYLIDIVFGMVLGSIIGMVAGSSFAEAILGEEIIREAMESLGEMSGLVSVVVNSIAGMSFMFLVFVLMEAVIGQSPGKMLLGIKIGNQDGTQTEVSKLLVRAFCKYFSSIMSLLTAITGIAILASLGSFGGFIIFIGFFFALGDNRLTFHDMMAITAVYRKSEMG